MAIAAAMAPLAASAMAPMAADGERDAQWTGSPVTAPGSQTNYSSRAWVTVIDMPVQPATIEAGATPVEALGRGLGRNIPNDQGVEIVDRKIVTVQPVEQETWSRASPSTGISREQSSRSGGGEAVGPQGWQGDLGDAMHSDDQQSMADDVGPQGWERNDQLSEDQAREGEMQTQTAAPEVELYAERINQPPDGPANYSSME